MEKYMSQDKNLDNRVSIDNMADAYSTLIEGVGEDLTRDGLIDTPNRAAKAMKFLTKGYEQTIDEVVNGALFDSSANDMVLVT
ncbi:MAG: GTP cyclohydrolase I, partial [Gammaproteobacteria bacterium]